MTLPHPEMKRLESKALSWAENIIQAFDKGVYRKRFFNDDERIKYLAEMLVAFKKEPAPRKMK